VRDRFVRGEGEALILDPRHPHNTRRPTKKATLSPRRPRNSCYAQRSNSSKAGTSLRYGEAAAAASKFAFTVARRTKAEDSSPLRKPVSSCVSRKKEVTEFRAFLPSLSFSFVPLGESSTTTIPRKCSCKGGEERQPCRVCLNCGRQGHIRSVHARCLISRKSDSLCVILDSARMQRPFNATFIQCNCSFSSLTKLIRQRSAGSFHYREMYRRCWLITRASQ